jgi:nucleoside-diphosphate-sugar epimerase
MFSKAIITGATGLVGRYVARCLVKNDVDVLCIGRNNLSQTDVDKIFGKGVTYLQLDMMDIVQLSKAIDNINWQPGHNCVFYHFAWSGAQKLTDGSAEDQLKNVTFSSTAIKAAKNIGCSKFINSGTIEETYAEWHLNKKSKFKSPQANYAIAKLASRDMCLMTAYLEKIDYIHTRLSVPLSPDLSIGGYIPQTLKKIITGENYNSPKNEQLFDMVSTEDIALAYYLLGSKGVNKSDYYIGCGKPTTLKDYFSQFEKYIRGLSLEEGDYSDIFSSYFFKTELLHKDTNFVSSYNQYNFFEK